MKDRQLKNSLRVAIRNFQLECIKVELEYRAAQFSDLEKQGMIPAYNDRINALANISNMPDVVPIRPVLIEQLDKWIDILRSDKNKSNTPFEIGYVYAFRQSIKDIQYLVDE